MGYNGTVSSSLSLYSAGSGFTMAFITATATGTSTGLDSYDISGSADVATQGSIIGIGRGSATANRSASYGSQKLGTPAEVWGFASGRSSLSFESRTANSMVSTLGTQNGMHTDSRSIQDILGVRSTVSNSRITSYASTINDARINVSSSGSAISEAWDTSPIKSNDRIHTEEAASSATGEARGYAESNGVGDTANSYSVIQSSASSSSNNTVMSVSGGPSAYSSSIQSSNSARTWSESWAMNSSWGSITRSNTGISAIEYGQLSSLGAGAQVYQSSAHSTSFAKIAMSTNMTTGIHSSSFGTLNLDTYSRQQRAGVQLQA